MMVLDSGLLFWATLYKAKRARVLRRCTNQWYDIRCECCNSSFEVLMVQFNSLCVVTACW